MEVQQAALRNEGQRRNAGRARREWVAASFIIVTGFDTYMRKRNH